MAKKNNNIILMVAIDTEFVNKECISLQIYINSYIHQTKKILVFNEKFVDSDLEEEILSESQKNDFDVLFVSFSDDECHLHYIICEFIQTYFSEEEYGNSRFEVYLIFFYSPKDLEFAFGFNLISDYFCSEIFRNTRNWICQKRAITGGFLLKTDSFPSKVKYFFRDLKGYTNSNLKTLASSVNVSMDDKDTLDSYKESMHLALKHKTDVFIKYAIGDVLATMKIYEEKTRLMNLLLKETFNFPYFLCYYPHTIKQSNGSLVSDISLKLIFFKFSGEEKNFARYVEKVKPLQLAFAKLSILDPYSPGYRDNVGIISELFEKTTLEECLQFCREYEREVRSLLYGKCFQFRPTSYGSVEWFLYQSHLSTVGFNALVSGGRCCNQQPYTWRFENTLDVDIVSCYGSSLASFDFPIGIPCMYGTGLHEKKLTLKEFLKLYEHELVPNLYKITVSGELSFGQDLIYSKLLSGQTLKATIERYKKEFHEGLDDAAHVSSAFVLMTHQIENGIITQDILDALRAVANNQELKEIMNLQVVTAAFWKKSDYISDPHEWVKKVLSSTGDLIYDNENNAILDQRTRAWTSFPIGEFITPLLKKRKSLKSKMKVTKDPTLKAELNAMQESLKLMINTLYGVLASIYFEIGNTVVADNITARARCESWKLAKALLGIQIITDGTSYQPGQVLFFLNGSVKKPSLSTFQNIEKLKSYRYVYRGNLGGLDWNLIYEKFKSLDFTQDEKVLYDQLVLEHVKNFWSNYNFDFKFQLEHKYACTSHISAMYSKAHYSYTRKEPKTDDLVFIFYRIRGIHKEVEESNNPTLQLLKNICLGNDKIPSKLDFVQKSILKIGTYLTHQKSKNPTRDLEGLRPGDVFYVTKTLRFFNMFFPVKNKEEYLKRVRRTQNKYGFERRATSLSELKQLMMEDRS